MLTSKIVPTKVAFIAAGTFNQQWMRTFEANPTGPSVEALRNVTRGGVVLTPSALSGVATDIIKPSAQPSAPANIIGGWGEERYRFMAAFDVYMHDGSVRKQIISGYTNYAGVSHSGAIDPEMQLFINSSMVLRATTYQDERGSSTHYSQLSNSNLLINQNQFSFNPNIKEQSQFTQRPQDIYDTLSANSDALRDGATETIDFRTKISNNVSNSRKANNSASSYLSSCLQAHRKAIIDVATSKERTDVLSEASGNATYVDITADPILLAMAFNGKSGYRNRGVVTYEDLCTIAPGFDSIAFVMNKGQCTIDINRMPHVVGDTAELHQATHENAMVTILVNSVTAAMADTLLTGASFTATNRTMTGDIVITVDETCAFLDGLDLSANEAYFLNAINAALTEASYGNTREFLVSVRVDIYGETRVELSMDGGPIIQYCIPSFADSVMSPNLCKSMEALNEISHGVENISTNIQYNLIQDVNNPYLNTY